MRKLMLRRRNFIRPDVPKGSFIDQFRNYADRITDASSAFKEITALFCISSVSRQVLTHPRYKHVNEYFMLIGESTLSRKSTTLGLARDFLERRIQTEEPILPYKSIPSSSSTEGLLQALKEANESAYMICEEYQGELDNYVNKEYKKDIPNFMLRFFDGTPVQHGLSNREKSVNIQNPFLSILVDTQPESLAKSMDGSLNSRGFYARFCVAYDRTWEERSQRRLTEEDINVGLEAKMNLRTLRDILELREQPLRISISEDAYQTLAQYQKECNEQAKNDSLSSPYYGRAEDHMIRISMLYCINEWAMDPTRMDTSPIVENRHMLAAKVIFQNSIESWQSFFPFIASHFIDRNRRVMFYNLKSSMEEGKPWETVRDTIADMGIQQSDIEKVLDNVKISDGLKVIDVQKKEPIPLDRFRTAIRELGPTQVALTLQSNWDSFQLEKSQNMSTNIAEQAGKNVKVEVQPSTEPDKSQDMFKKLQEFRQKS